MCPTSRPFAVAEPGELMFLHSERGREAGSGHTHAGGTLLCPARRPSLPRSLCLRHQIFMGSHQIPLLASPSHACKKSRPCTPSIPKEFYPWVPCIQLTLCVSPRLSSSPDSSLSLKSMQTGRRPCERGRSTYVHYAARFPDKMSPLIKLPCLFPFLSLPSVAIHTLGRKLEGTGSAQRA